MCKRSSIWVRFSRGALVVTLVVRLQKRHFGVESWWVTKNESVIGGAACVGNWCAQHSNEGLVSVRDGGERDKSLKVSDEMMASPKG